MARPIFQVDAFSDQPFHGNPAGVCLLDAPAGAAWMQQVAAEMNLAETAFLHPITDGYNLRWFTPTREVDLCGHATLASAHILWETNRLQKDQPAIFQTRSGVLTCRQRSGWIEMDFPSTPAERIDPPLALFRALGIPEAPTARSRFDLLVELENEEQVRSVKPNFEQLRNIETRGVIITAPGSSPFDFVSRFFAPRFGIDEDPVTGSAHCTLGHWWQEKLRKSDFLARQISARGGVVRVGVRSDCTLLAGQAVTVLRGDWLCSV